MYEAFSAHIGNALTFAQTNILVDAGGRIRIAGLGVASIPSVAPPISVDRFFHGTAPELVNPQRFRLTNTGVTKATDMYAFGTLAWEVSGGGINTSGRVLRWGEARFSPDKLHSLTGTRLQGCIRC